MKNNKYILIRSAFLSEGRLNLLYGIRCVAGWRTVESCRGISSNKSSVQELVSLCNKLGLSPVHLADVVEDFIEQNK